jgi:hypothetical protein
MDERCVYLRDVSNPAILKKNVDSFVVGVVKAVFCFSSENQEGSIFQTQ